MKTILAIPCLIIAIGFFYVAKFFKRFGKDFMDIGINLAGLTSRKRDI